MRHLLGPAHPPGTALDPVRDHLAHLPEATTPQELVGPQVSRTVSRTVLRTVGLRAHFHEVVVGPHFLLLRSSLRRASPLSVLRSRMGSSHPRPEHPDRTGVRLKSTVHRFPDTSRGPTTGRQTLRCVPGPAWDSFAAMSEHPSIARFRTEL